MNLTNYVSDLRQQLATAAEAGGEEAAAIAERLAMALEPATRLVLLDALSAAASEITRELAPGSVDVRLRGREVEFVVSVPPAPPASAPTPAEPPHAAESASGERALERQIESQIRRELAGAGETDEGGTSRTTLRLPEHIKVRMEEAAAREGLSVNSWLVRVVTTALEPKVRTETSRTPGGGESFSGWVR
ncbi:MAG: hypothetical protein KIT43_08360 [Bauldia sp.]|nr:hypothetical protein [Bauldia sp.]MCW5716863.1 hypothetical protein [Bauldia sp.]